MDLDLALEQAREQIDAEPHVVAEDWTVYQLVPDEIKFWQAHPERPHTRLRYRLIDGHWTQPTLWP